ncbi:hypothetical protein ACLPJF_08350 [Pseudomonas vlassakiae]|jgi:hypothetical protein|uniref:hypothetical protein n=1 Tax=Pseudomonas TaxID=286 RepID=UPI000C1A488F|nr:MULTISPECIES: hypothetical protein [unclassified Pseudomonas]AXQ49110.1 hypothetical protein DZC31_19770 [Stenotrophomonas rhizophila]MBS3186322.1 hypothetical protein [Pseudomonas sp. PCH44]PIK77867.1 hypothetical protein CQW31_14405 [Pseudomonas sp. 382]
MKSIKGVTSLLLMALLAGCGTAQAPSSDSVKVANTGLVKFAQRMDGPQHPGGNQCSVSVGAVGESRKKTKMSTAGCGNDVVTFFKLEDVASSTLIDLSSEFKCWGGDWLFRVRAIKQPTTSVWLDIRDLRNREYGDIIAPGVEVIRSEYHHGNIEGKLSCTEIFPPER